MKMLLEPNSITMMVLLVLGVIMLKFWKGEKKQEVLAFAVLCFSWATMVAFEVILKKFYSLNSVNTSVLFNTIGVACLIWFTHSVFENRKMNLQLIIPFSVVIATAVFSIATLYLAPFLWGMLIFILYFLMLTMIYSIKEKIFSTKIRVIYLMGIIVFLAGHFMILVASVTGLSQVHKWCYLILAFLSTAIAILAVYEIKQTINDLNKCINDEIKKERKNRNRQQMIYKFVFVEYPYIKLSDTQIYYLSFLFENPEKTYYEIAEQHNKHVNTIKKCYTNILKKFNLRTREQLLELFQNVEIKYHLLYNNKYYSKVS
ncbi:MAG: hypothetical protein MJB14_10395 [Spirochaetes bacterium]|nr:hypothetical protein [Spirochaetota bacterium]